MNDFDLFVERFLAWQLPKDFQPDGGVSFNPYSKNVYGWPTGTNLLTEEQARAMFEHCLAGLAANKDMVELIGRIANGESYSVNEAKVIHARAKGRHI